MASRKIKIYELNGKRGYIEHFPDGTKKFVDLETMTDLTDVSSDQLVDTGDTKILEWEDP